MFCCSFCNSFFNILAEQTRARAGLHLKSFEKMYYNIVVIYRENVFKINIDKRIARSKTLFPNEFHGKNSLEYRT